jgi:hypothetical protein
MKTGTEQSIFNSYHKSTKFTSGDPRMPVEPAKRLKQMSTKFKYRHLISFS